MAWFLERQRNILMYTFKWVHELVEVQEQSSSTREDFAFRPEGQSRRCSDFLSRLSLHRLSMFLPNAWRGFIFLVLLTGVLAEVCRKRQMYYNKDSLIALKDMGGSLTLQCSREKQSLGAASVNLTKLVDKGEEWITVVCEMVHQMKKIYNMKLDSVPWPRLMVESFWELLDGQLRDLKMCARKRGSRSRPRRRATIKKYFSELTKFLKREGFSACAWEITRTETRAYFQQFSHIMAKFSERR